MTEDDGAVYWHKQYDRVVAELEDAESRIDELERDLGEAESRIDELERDLEEAKVGDIHIPVETANALVRDGLMLHNEAHGMTIRGLLEWLAE